METRSSNAPPRSQFDRSRSTRARVLDAAVACIAEEGFQPTPLARIAERAELTTGAIQHQFGDKAALLAAVVERGFERLVERVARQPGGAAPLEERVAFLVRALWEGYDAVEATGAVTQCAPGRYRGIDPPPAFLRFRYRQTSCGNLCP